MVPLCWACEKLNTHGSTALQPWEAALGGFVFNGASTVPARRAAWGWNQVSRVRSCVRHGRGEAIISPC